MSIKEEIYKLGFRDGLTCALVRIGWSLLPEHEKDLKNLKWALENPEKSFCYRPHTIKYYLKYLQRKKAENNIIEVKNEK